MTSRIRAITAAALLLMLAGCSGGGDAEAGRQTATPAAPTAAATSPAASTAPAPVNTEPGLKDGVYAVGSEIKPGTYSTTAGPRPCYWARLRSFGQADSVIDEANLEPGQHARVVVESSDRGFKVSNGCVWHRDRAV